MIQIGIDHAGYRTRSTTTLTLLKDSKLMLGEGVRLCQGSSILVGVNASLQMKDYARLGDGAEIICKDRIVIGVKTDVTWDCQVTDFYSHPMRNMRTGEIHPMTSPVLIGDYCWIGPLGRARALQTSARGRFWWSRELCRLDAPLRGPVAGSKPYQPRRGTQFQGYAPQDGS